MLDNTCFVSCSTTFIQVEKALKHHTFIHKYKNPTKIPLPLHHPPPGVCTQKREFQTGCLTVAEICGLYICASFLPTFVTVHFQNRSMRMNR